MLCARVYIQWVLCYVSDEEEEEDEDGGGGVSGRKPVREYCNTNAYCGISTCSIYNQSYHIL
jgi:hypothetical protein